MPVACAPTMLETEEFPASGADLDSCLTDVDGDDFSHFEVLLFLIMKYLKCQS